MNQQIPPAPSSAPLTTQTSTPTGFSASGGGQPDDLLTILKALALVWKHKKLIALVTLLFTIGGVVHALLATPVYTSEAILAPKEADKSGGAGLLAQMGEMGGLVASQMGVSMGTTYERIAIIGKSHDLAEVVIAKHNLLPVLFPKKYDFKNNCWKIKDTANIPTTRHGVKALTGGVITVSTDIKKQIVRLKASMYDPALAEKIAEYYVDELDNKIKSDVIIEAKVKRAYLEAQMKSTADPWIMQKLQALSILEMEKSMMVAGRAIVVLETPMMPLKKTAPKRRNIVAVSFFLGLFFSAGFFLSLDKIKELREKYRGKV